METSPFWVEFYAFEKSQWKCSLPRVPDAGTLAPSPERPSSFWALLFLCPELPSLPSVALTSASPPWCQAGFSHCHLPHTHVLPPHHHQQWCGPKEGSWLLNEQALKPRRCLTSQLLCAVPGTLVRAQQYLIYLPLLNVSVASMFSIVYSLYFQSGEKKLPEMYRNVFHTF